MNKSIREYIDSRTTPTLKHISAGEYVIGASNGDVEAYPNEYPQHIVYVKNFSMMEHVVRTSDFQAFIWDTNYVPNEGALFFNGDHWEMDDDLTWESPGYTYIGRDTPVTCINFWDIQEYIKWISKKSGLQYRLPSEAEWEIAARSGTQTSRFWGSTMRRAKKYANIPQQKNFRPVPVMTYEPNQWGLYDMLGNVFEWTGSNYCESYDGSELRLSLSKKAKVYKGGSFNSEASVIRCSARAKMPPELACNQIGFRLCIDGHLSHKNIKYSDVGKEIRKLNFGEKKSFKLDLK